MVIDLAGAEEQVETVRSQVCVVGAGIAGLVVARKLARQGVDVVVLEAGGRELEADGQRLFETAVLVGRRHEGTSAGRARLLGGTSLWWGGQVLGMSRDAAAEWPVAWEEIAKFTVEVERLIEVDALPFEAKDFFAAVGEGEPGEREGLQCGGDLRPDDEFAAVEAFDPHTGKRCEDEGEDLAGEADDAEHERGVGELIDEPAGGEARHPGADEGDALAADEELEIAMAQSAPRMGERAIHAGFDGGSGCGHRAGDRIDSSK